MGTQIEDLEVEAPDAELADDATAIDESDAAEQAETETDPVGVDEGRPGVDRPYEIHLPGGKVVRTWNAQFKLAGTELSIHGAFPDEGLKVEGTWSGRVKGVHVDRHPKNGLILLAVVQVDDATLDIMPMPAVQPELPLGDAPAAHDLRTTKLDDETIQVGCTCGAVIGEAADETEALAMDDHATETFGEEDPGLAELAEAGYSVDITVERGEDEPEGPAGLPGVTDVSAGQAEPVSAVKTGDAGKADEPSISSDDAGLED